MKRLYSLMFLVGCGGAQPAPAPAPAHTAADLLPLCKAHFAREQQCSDDYLATLLDYRISVDMPKGIADEAKAKGKPALLEIAHTEFAADTAPDKVDQMCNAITNVPADRVEGLVHDGQSCAAMAECKPFAQCAVALERSFIQAGGVH